MVIFIYYLRREKLVESVLCQCVGFIQNLGKISEFILSLKETLKISLIFVYLVIISFVLVITVVRVIIANPCWSYSKMLLHNVIRTARANTFFFSLFERIQRVTKCCMLILRPKYLSTK